MRHNGQRPGDKTDFNQGKRAHVGEPWTWEESASGRARPGWRRVLLGYLLLPHIVPVLVVELATAAFAIVAWNGLPPWHILMPLLLAMLGGQLMIGAVNELVDMPLDAVAKPWKPLPSEAVSIGGAKAMVVL